MKPSHAMGDTDPSSQGEPSSCGKMTRKEKEALCQQRLAAANAALDGTLPRVCIDLALGHLMNQKEITSLACQLRQVYGANRRAGRPLQVWLTSLDREGAIYQTCAAKNDGFNKYMVKKTNEHYGDVFLHRDIIYLTPDSPHILSELEKDKVYIIGGLVDESILKNTTYHLAAKSGFETRRLPIMQCMKHAEKGTFSQVLAINQVFDILLQYYHTGNWEESIVSAVPKRKGFIQR